MLAVNALLLLLLFWEKRKTWLLRAVVFYFSVKRKLILVFLFGLKCCSLLFPPYNLKGNICLLRKEMIIID